MPSLAVAYVSRPRCKRRPPHCLFGGDKQNHSDRNAGPEITTVEDGGLTRDEQGAVETVGDEKGRYD